MIFATFSKRSRPPVRKIRVVLESNGTLTATANLIRPLSHDDPFHLARIVPETIHPLSNVPELRISLDTEPTTSSLFTSTKTTYRPHYDAARKRANIPPLGFHAVPPQSDEVLLYNEKDEITETSIRNIAFFREGRWVTPPLSTGCLSGVVRRRLLEEGLILESNDKRELTKHSVEHNEPILTFNAVEGCRLGRLIVPTCA
jgi:4-amino-4-deoxychorismate lyase